MSIKLTGTTGIETPGLTVAPSTGAVKISSGTTAQRITPSGDGWIRYNSDTDRLESFDGVSWSSVGAGATGGGPDEVFVQNGQNITTSYTVPTGKNASSTGPVYVADGITVTVSSGSRWVVL